jgi:F-type H+-transporting ATPase subunit epsilon
MLPEHISLQVVTPSRQVLDVRVEWVEMPGLDGYLGILPGHAPLITELGVGQLTYRHGSETHYLTVIHGFAEVLPDRVIVLAEIAERAEEIDLQRATTSRDRAQQRLAKPVSELDLERATFAYERAMIRLYVAAKKTGYIGGTADEEKRSQH